MTNNRRKNRKRPYWGSVRFYRHLILTTVALLIIIPIGTSVYFGIQNKNIKSSRQELITRNAQLQDRLAEGAGVPMASKAETAESESVISGEILVDLNSWELILVNDTHPLSNTYQVDLKEVQEGQCIDARISNDLNAMIAAAGEAGYQLHIYSSYRDLRKQQSLFNDCLKSMLDEGMEYQQAFYESKARIALPGTSEHQTGLSVDIASKDYSYLDENRGKQAEARWLADNSYLYGFILRYPEEKESVTGIKYEPEHFRYVGKTVARYMKDNELSLEEFCSLAQKDVRNSSR